MPFKLHIVQIYSMLINIENLLKLTIIGTHEGRLTKQVS